MASLTSYNSKQGTDASFSSFFHGDEETYIHKLVESSQNLSLVGQTNAVGSPNLRNKLDDGEIDIFSADKYFSGRMDEGSARKASLIAKRRSQDKKAELLHTEEGHIKPTLQVQTPSVYSESSWNSQSILLRRPRNSSRSKAKAPKKKFFAHLGCNCACSDKNSVDVEDHSDDYNQNVRAVSSEVPPYGKSIKTSLDSADIIRIKRLQQQNISGKDYPLSGHSSSLPNTLLVNKQSLEDQEAERKSLEVFGSSITQSNGSKSFGLERRLNMLAWDAIPKVEEIEIQGPISAESIKDTESEASSDLFEIECLSCSANPVVLPRHTLEGGDSSCASPTTCYAPSEASVEWSIVTASAADFSIVSDSEEQAATAYRKMLPPRARRPTAHISEQPKTRYGGILSGCKSQKAVRVAGNVYTTSTVREKVESPRIARSDSFTQMMKFQMDTTQKVGFGSKYRKDVLYIQ